MSVPLILLLMVCAALSMTTAVFSQLPNNSHPIAAVSPSIAGIDVQKVDFWQKAAWLGTFLNGLGVIVGAFIAGYTLYFINRKSLTQAWVIGYHQLYADFWANERLSNVRKWISSDSEYAVIEDIMIRDRNGDSDHISSDENDMLESIDRFCATMVRMKSFGRLSQQSSQENLWQLLYGDYWLELFKSRKELELYANRYWKGLFD